MAGHSLKFWTSPGTETECWETPQGLFDFLNEVFSFNLDVCALPENAKCPIFYSPDDDGLSQPWHGRCWMDPPYGRPIKAWVKKAHDEALAGHALVVALLPAKTDTTWWHDFVSTASVFFFRGRLRFNNSRENAPFGSALAIWWPRPGAGEWWA
ncbi:MAG: DNA N-6-adenine-methyltransferase [Pseudomonadota bacterium]